MSEQNPVENVQNEETSEISVEALQKQLIEATTRIEDYSSQLEALKNKNNELLSEKKKTQAARQEAEEKAKQEAEEKAKAEGNFKQLYESLKAESAKEAEALRTQLTSVLESTKQEKIMVEAYKIANEASAIKGKATELMAQDIAKNLDIVDGQFVTKENGQLSSKPVTSLVEHYSTSEDWAPLRNSNRSSGGSASGQGTTSTKAQMTIAEFQEAYPTPSAQLAARDSVDLID